MEFFLIPDTMSDTVRITENLSAKIATFQFRYLPITHDIANNEAALERMKADWERYQSVVKRGKDGNPLNDLKIDSCNLTDEKNMGIHLQGLAQCTDTHGHYQRIGEVYGFPFSVISERTLVDGKESVQNRLVVERNYKYKYNNGYIAMSDTHAACMNFVNALEKTPGIIAQYEERTAKLKANVPQLEAIISKTWGNENELKQLKSELAPSTARLLLNLPQPTKCRAIERDSTTMRITARRLSRSNPNIPRSPRMPILNLRSILKIKSLQW